MEKIEKEDKKMLTEEEEAEKAFDMSEVKAVRRTVTNVYSKGTFNPAVQSDVKLNLGKSRGATKQK